MSWDAVEINGGISEYVIYRDGEEVDRTATTTYTEDTLTTATTYTFEVTAVSAMGAESDYSESVEVTTS